MEQAVGAESWPVGGLRGRKLEGGVHPPVAGAARAVQDGARRLRAASPASSGDMAEEPR